MEWIARGITIRCGGVAYFSNYPMSGAEVRRASVKHTLTLARRIGHIIRTARSRRQEPFEELEAFIATTSYGAARRIFSGKVVDLDRQTLEGFTRGAVTIAPDRGHGRSCVITFQNENLVARAGDDLLALVPDIITVLDAETAVPITNETLRYGQRVMVMAVRVPEIMRSPAALRQFGPAAFGLDEIYRPLSI
jgi:hypothetical protein